MPCIVKGVNPGFLHVGELPLIEGGVLASVNSEEDKLISYVTRVAEPSREDSVSY